jgi:hypothetical protein
MWLAIARFFRLFFTQGTNFHFNHFQVAFWHAQYSVSPVKGNVLPGQAELFAAHRLYAVFKENLDLLWAAQALYHTDAKGRVIH